MPPPHLVQDVLGIEPRAVCLLAKPSASWATSLALSGLSTSPDYRIFSWSLGWASRISNLWK